MSGAHEHEPEGATLRAWERWPGEPAASYRLFVEYVGTSSLRLAVARLAKKDGRKVPRRVSGRAWTYACRYRFRERRDAYLVRVAEREKAALETRRRAARARRVARLERLSVLFDAGLAKLDLERMHPSEFLRELVRTHVDERLELRDSREDDAGRVNEHEPPLPAIEDRIRPPEPATPDPE